jgi:hypothetical protein
MYLFMYKRIFQESKSFSKMIDQDYGPFSSDIAETGFFPFSYCSNAVCLRVLLTLTFKVFI